MKRKASISLMAFIAAAATEATTTRGVTNARGVATTPPFAVKRVCVGPRLVRPKLGKRLTSSRSLKLAHPVAVLLFDFRPACVLVESFRTRS